MSIPLRFSTTTNPSEAVPNARPLADLDIAALGDLIRRAATELAGRGSPLAASELTRSLGEVSNSVGAAWADIRWTQSQWLDEGPRASVTEASARPCDLRMTFRAVREARPGPAWKALFDEMWPAYRSWYLSEGETIRPDSTTCRKMLHTYMPELVPTWEGMVALAGDDDLAARMLSMWEPPTFLPGCSQAVLTRPEAALVRNYDYDPNLFEAVILSTRFSQRRVIGTSDCLWGLLDGMNDRGLAVSLTFGGWPGSGPGFAIPLVVRYLLEVADTVQAACVVLRDLPVAMAYNLSMVDRGGDSVTAFVAPGRAPEFTRLPVATNHRGTTPDYPEHAAALHSVQRQGHLLRSLSNDPDPLQLAREFLLPPLRNKAYNQAFGTLYTALYRPADGAVRYLWPRDVWDLTFESPCAVKTVTLPAA